MKYYFGKLKFELFIDSFYKGDTEYIVDHRLKKALTYKAYRSYQDQVYRCHNEKCWAYKFYGAKGIKVKYKSNEYVNWWMDNYMKNPLKQPSVDRIDSNKDYSFENITLIERSENSKRRIQDKGNPQYTQPIYLLNEKDEPIGLFKSTGEADRIFGFRRDSVRSATKRNGKCYGLKFKYV